MLALCHHPGRGWGRWVWWEVPVSIGGHVGEGGGEGGRVCVVDAEEEEEEEEALLGARAAASDSSSSRGGGGGYAVFMFVDVVEHG